MMRKSFFIMMYLLMPYKIIYCQLSGYHLLEYQYGSIPGVSEKELSTLYDNLNIKYRQENITGEIRLEQFLTQHDDRSYLNLSQYNIKYTKDKLDLRIGHFYDIIGNGLLSRSYEISGSVLEDQVHRVRHGFYRDIEGVFFKYQSDKFMVKALKGSPLVNELPPTFDKTDRRVDNIDALELMFSLKNHNPGIAFLRNVNDFDNNKYLSVYADGNLPLNISYKTEFASGTDNFSFDQESRYAYYISLNYSYRSFGTSLEFKDYKNFFLGSGFSDPPALVKEHSYRVLNRSTHVPHLTDESGYQAELFYYFKNGTFLTFNMVRLKNEIQNIDTHVFNEYFLEIFTYLNDNSLKAFLDYANDPFKGEKNRFSTGLSFDKPFSASWSTLFDFEYQYFIREIVQTNKIQNYVIGLTVSKSPVFSTGLVWEMTTDPMVRNSGKNKKNKNFLGLNISYKVNPRNSFTLFAGSRRGGPACTSGICYEVLDFRGVELRITNKF